MRVQVAVGGADGDGRRPVEVYARAEGTWRRHASGWLAVADGTGPADDFAVWPPAGAEPAEVAGLYAGLAERGYGYGPAFRGLRAAWRRGQEIFAEVALPEGTEAGGFGVHPALLDAALHGAALDGAVLAGPAGPPGQVLLPFAWSGVTVHGPGASALRVRLSRAGDGSLAVAAADDAGAPVVSVASVVLRPVPPGQLRGGSQQRDDLSAVAWVPVPVPESGGHLPEVVRAGAGTGCGAGSARAEVGRVLGWCSAGWPGTGRMCLRFRG